MGIVVEGVIICNTYYHYWRRLTGDAADLLYYDKEHEQGNDNNDNDDNDHGLTFFVGRGTAMFVVAL